MNVRSPVVAGTFYPGTEKEINKLIDRILDTEKEKIDYSFAEKELIGCVVPHAGYVYSAYEALHFFEIIRESSEQYDTFIIINPNHTGYGEAVEVDAHDSWRTPMGNVDLDRQFIGELECEGACPENPYRQQAAEPEDHDHSIIRFYSF